MLIKHLTAGPEFANLLQIEKTEDFHNDNVADAVATGDIVLFCGKCGMDRCQRLL